MPPTPSLQWLNSLKSKELQSLAAAVGTNSTGTKASLIAALQFHLPTGLFPTQSGSSEDSGNGKMRREIISIDMGIRNLAYCRISLPPTWPSGLSPSPRNSTSALSSVPTITEWARVCVSSNPNSTISMRKSKKGNSRKSNASSTAAAIEPMKTPPETSASSKREPFDPRTFSHYAYNLVTHLLFHQNPQSQPTQILIERQRFRSMGGSAVQEWTLRVNMFEAMIYAVLKTLAKVGRWTGGSEQGVYAVEPARVSRFWVGGEADVEVEDGGTGGKKGLSKGAKNKVAKIRVVEGWLEEALSEKSRGRFRLEGNAKVLGEGFLKKRKGGRDVRVQQEGIGEKTAEEVEIGKLDDLADALLQGMAWVKWEENRRRVLEGGISAVSSL